jgi:hypothetical protein
LKTIPATAPTIPANGGAPVAAACAEDDCTEAGVVLAWVVVDVRVVVGVENRLLSALLVESTKGTAEELESPPKPEDPSNPLPVIDPIAVGSRSTPKRKAVSAQKML